MTQRRSGSGLQEGALEIEKALVSIRDGRLGLRRGEGMVGDQGSWKFLPANTLVR